MTTCSSSISTTTTVTELSSGTTYSDSLSTSHNALYLLTNDLTQSVFFNIRILTNTSNIMITLTIYNKLDLSIIGSLNITQSNINTSFSIAAGSYYVCIRPVSLSYDIQLTPTFISYSNVARFFPYSYFGYSVSTTLTVPVPSRACNKPLLYQIIEGALPPGLVMLQNGYIYGNLPMLDCDTANNGNLPTSNTWYHQISDDEYVTNWGRAYRFRIRLTFFDNNTKEDIKWYYIYIVNDYSKNLAFVDTFEVLDDNKVATFEEKVALKTQDLCCSTNIAQTTDTSSNDLYNNVIQYKVDDDVNPIINVDTTYHYTNMVDSDMIPFNNSDILFDNDHNPKFFDLYRQSNDDLIQYYIKYFDAPDNNLVTLLKDSCMFQVFLSENNINSKYIIQDVYSRFDYTGISLSFIYLDNINYIELKNTYEQNINDASTEFNNNYIEAYSSLPLTSYSMHGVELLSSLYVKGK